MASKYSVPRGTNDILPEESSLWQKVEQISQKIFQIYGYKEIRTPLFEEIDLFSRSMGETSDVVQKQMLSVSRAASDKNEVKEKEGFALRPEGTASIVRSYIENHFDRKENLSKFYYVGPMFRGERPQKERLRQFHQIGVEAIGPGPASPYLDAEVISLSVKLLEALGLTDFKLRINTLGAPEDKENLSKKLRKEIKPFIAKLSEESQKRFARNVFRILDSKNKADQAIVAQLKLDHSHLSSESKSYYSQVKAALDGLGIKYEEDLKLVRGLDYYTHTVFEISCSALGSQDALGAGGRYNNLVQQLGGPQVDAIGFALGIERILLAMSESKKNIADTYLDAFVVALDESSFKKGFEILGTLRDAGIAADMSYKLSSLKSQMRLADKSQASYLLLLGEDELKKNVVTVKDMKLGNQSQEKISDIIEVFLNLKSDQKKGK